MALVVTIENGFAEVGAGSWLMGPAQPAAFFGAAVRRRRKGWMVRDRTQLALVETSATAKCADSARPFLTYMPCAAPLSVVSGKVLIAPAAAHAGAKILKTIPFSWRGTLCVSEFASEWVVAATAGRTARVQVPDGETFSVRPDAAVAWTGAMPTGFCPRIGLMDLLLPRAPREMLLHFHGPCVVWTEGSAQSAFSRGFDRRRRAC